MNLHVLELCFICSNTNPCFTTLTKSSTCSERTNQTDKKADHPEASKRDSKAEEMKELIQVQMNKNLKSLWLFKK